MNSKELLLTTLNNTETVKVQFHTKAGTVRDMNCTRNFKAIPQEKWPGINSPKLNGPDIICVYDQLINDWRAFRYDSVIDFTAKGMTHIFKM